MTKMVYSYICIMYCKPCKLKSPADEISNTEAVVHIL